MNAVTPTGLQIPTRDDIRNAILNGTADYPGLYQIYGPDINVGPNSPDGQMVEIVVQAIADMYELIAQVYNSFNPDASIGRVLDQRAAINGVLRRGATFTLQDVEVTVSQALTLPGLDTSPLSPFTVADSAGNQFQLVSTYSFGAAGTQSLAFQAAQLGPVETVIGTITQIVTTTLGVSGVNNPTAATSVGQAEETDSQLRIRRSNSVSLPSRGYLEGLLGALLDTDGVTEAEVLENDTNSTDANGIPAHSIWAIVEGGTDDDVALAIYKKRNAGCGMKGSVTVDVPQIDGTTFQVAFDRPTDEDLYISFDVVAISGAVDPDYIKDQLVELLSYRINQAADASAIVALVKEIAPNASVSNAEVSDDDVTYVPLLDPTGVNYRFIADAARINIGP